MPETGRCNTAEIYPLRRWAVPLSGHYPAKPTSPKTKVKKSPIKDGFNPPKHEIESFAMCILPAIQAYFESEIGQREFAEWQAEQKAKNNPP